MDKETLVRNLQERIGDSDFGVLSQRTIDSIIEPLLPMFADDASVSDASYELPVNVLKSYIGQYRHDVAEGIRQAQDKIKQKPEVKPDVKQQEDPKPEILPTPPQPDIDTLISEKIKGYFDGLQGEDGILGKLSKDFSDFKHSYEERRKSERESDIKGRLGDYLLGLDSSIDDDDFVLEYTLERFNVDLDEDFETQKSKFKEAYEANYKRINKGRTFTPFEGGAGGESDSTQAFESFLQEKATREEAARANAEAIKSLMI